jgi:predicted acylesterase/phospholipase RssA
MLIDTLVFSGGSTKAPAFIGSLRALRECNIINETYDGIKHIITCSVGILIALMILLKVNEQVIEETIKRICFSELLDLDDIHIHSLLFECGLFDNRKLSTIIQSILRERYSTDDMSLHELYQLTPIKLTTKVVNHTKGCVEYMSYENEPNLSIMTLLLMTTAIPLFFKPIKYKECLYVDGGASGGFPIEIAGDTYLGIQLNGGVYSKEKHSILKEIPLIDYIIQGQVISCQDTTIPDIKNIIITSSIHFSNFKLSLQDKQKLINDGYIYTKQHIKRYNLINDTLHHEDLSPIE